MSEKRITELEAVLRRRKFDNDVSPLPARALRPPTIPNTQKQPIPGQLHAAGEPFLPKPNRRLVIAAV